MKVLNATAIVQEIEDTPDPDTECVSVWARSVRELERQRQAAEDRANELHTEFEVLTDSCGHLRAADLPPHRQMIESARKALNKLRVTA